MLMQEAGGIGDDTLHVPPEERVGSDHPPDKREDLLLEGIVLDPHAVHLGEDETEGKDICLSRDGRHEGRGVLGRPETFLERLERFLQFLLIPAIHLDEDMVRPAPLEFSEKILDLPRVLEVGKIPVFRREVLVVSHVPILVSMVIYLRKRERGAPVDQKKSEEVILIVQEIIHLDVAVDIAAVV